MSFEVIGRAVRAMDQADEDQLLPPIALGYQERLVRAVLASVRELPSQFLDDLATPELDQNVWHDIIDEILK